MKGLFEYFSKVSAILTMCVGVGYLYGAQPVNPRGSTQSDARSEVRSVTRGDGASGNVVSRGTTNRNVVGARGAAARTAVPRTVCRRRAADSGRAGNRP